MKINDSMVQSGRINAEVLNLIKPLIKPGITGLEIDQIAEKEIKKRGATPAFKGYQGYQYSSCISINNCLVHGLPSENVFEAGDVVSFDLGVNYKGWITDAAFTVALSPVSEHAATLVKATAEALEKGIAKARPGNRIGVISETIEKVANHYNLGIVYELAGHGVGQSLHQPPSIPNYGPANKGAKIVMGQTLAIEPMFCLRPDAPGSGKNKASISISPDKWSVLLEKNNIGAHFEKTVLVTENEPIILTNLLT